MYQHDVSIQVAAGRLLSHPFYLVQSSQMSVVARGLDTYGAQPSASNVVYPRSRRVLEREGSWNERKVVLSEAFARGVKSKSISTRRGSWAVASSVLHNAGELDQLFCPAAAQH